MTDSTTNDFISTMTVAHTNMAEAKMAEQQQHAYLMSLLIGSTAELLTRLSPAQLEAVKGFIENGCEPEMYIPDSVAEDQNCQEHQQQIAHLTEANEILHRRLSGYEGGNFVALVEGDDPQLAATILGITRNGNGELLEAHHVANALKPSRQQAAEPQGANGPPIAPQPAASVQPRGENSGSSNGGRKKKGSDKGAQNSGGNRSDRQSSEQTAERPRRLKNFKERVKNEIKISDK